jgi:hypothetical protein
MLVDVKELNYLGGRIPRHERGGLPVTRGELSIGKMWTHDGLDNAPVHAQLLPPKLEPLYSVKLRYWRGRTLVLVGEQYAPLPKRSRAAGRFPQVWLCKLVTEAEVEAEGLAPDQGPAGPMRWPALDPS